MKFRFKGERTLMAVERTSVSFSGEDLAALAGFQGPQGDVH